MTGLDMQPAVLCLAFSLLWAPAVYLAATRLDRGRAHSVSEMLWLAALLVAALPTLVAPALAAAGISLRAAPVVDIAPAPLTYQPITIVVESEPQVATPSMAPQISTDTLIEAAALLYISGVLLFFGVWLAKTIGFALRVGAAPEADLPHVRAALEDWRRRLDVDAPIRLKRSGAVSSVCVYGLFRPVILIPAELGARISEEDLVMMCAHELAHVKRGDPRLFAVLGVARVLFWFNPFVKRIAARAELAAEQSADALVLERGADRRAYAACFVEGLRFAAERAARAPLPVPSFTPFDRRSRRMRLDAILTGAAEKPRAPSRLVALVAVVGAGGLAFAQAALAVHPDARSADAPRIEVLPVDGPVTLGYGESFTDKNGEKRKGHSGVDIKARKGASVVAPADGVVLEATDLYRDQPAWGKVVVIDHGDGLITRYAHLDSYAVKKGFRVTAGEEIAKVGATGVVTGPHLHFETLLDGETVNPLVLAGAEERVAPRTPAAPAAPAAVIAPAAPAAEKAAPTPAVAPTPEAAPAPSPAPAPEAMTWSEDFTWEMEAPPAPAAPGDRLTPRAPMAFTMKLDESLLGALAPFPGADVLAPRVADGEVRAFRWSMDDGEADQDIEIVVDGEGVYAFDFGDGEKIVIEGDKELTPEQKKKVEEALARARIEMQKAREEHGKAMAEMRRAFDGQKSMFAFRAGDLDSERVNALEAAERARRDAERARRDADRALRDAERSGDKQALREAERAAERAERDSERAEQDAERAQEAAERAHEAMIEEAEAARERAMELAEEHRERAMEFAERQRDRVMVFSADDWEHPSIDEAEMLERRARALEEAEKDLARERAAIEKRRKEIEAERASAKKDERGKS